MTTKLIAEIETKLRSGNDVAVSRIHLDRGEAQAILALLRAMAAVEGELPPLPHWFQRTVEPGAAERYIIELRTTATALLAKKGLDAERYQWLRKHFEFTNDSMEEIWFNSHVKRYSPQQDSVAEELDAAIDAARRGGEGK